MEDYILNLLKENVIPAIGCTEPIAVALAATKAREILNAIPETIEIKLSKNVLKNGMGVGIPGTNQIGLHIAVALGVLYANSENKLELIKNISESNVKEANEFIKRTPIIFSIKETEEKLYIEVTCKKNNSFAKAIIAKNHTNFVFLEKNNNIILDNTKDLNNSNEDINVLYSNQKKITLKDIYDFTINCELEKISFITESAKINKEAALIGIEKNYGLNVNKIIKNSIEKNIYQDSILSYALILTTAAIDARMGGADVTIYSNSGSGDQGIIVTLPVLAFYEKYYKKELKNITLENDEIFIRALTLSHIVAIYIKQKLGVLSPLCGITTASIGTACGITFLMKGQYQHICATIKNCAANIIGMICDGAKNGCALKAASGVFNAFNAATLGINNICPCNTEGIVHNDVEITIDNLIKIGKKGMEKMDDVIIEMLLNK